MKELAAFVAQVKKETRRRKVALIASSRGGNTVRNYLKNGGGADSVSHAVLCGTPNKGIVISDTHAGRQRVQRRGAVPQGPERGPDDLIPGVELMAIRSDKNDKYSQPDGRFVGAPGKPTGVGYDALGAARRAQRRSSTASITARWRSTSSPSPRSTSSSPARPPARCSSPRSRSRR